MSSETNHAVLLVEDDPLVSLSTSDMLEDLGYAVHRALDARTALAEFERHESIALMIADVGLPDMDGYRLVARVRQRQPGLRVLFTTGYDTTVSGRAPADAITGYLEKPYRFDMLSAALERLLAAN